jgi:hypothetical protein
MEKMMGFDYVQMINDFQHISKSASKEEISTDDIDIFFEILTDAYVSMLEKGALIIEADRIPFKNNITKKFFGIALTCIQEGVMPNTTGLVLEFLLLQINRGQVLSLTESFEIFLLAKIMPILRLDGEYIKKYLDFLTEFCSDKIQYFQLGKFIKFIDIYKLTDCYVLNEMKEIL